MPPSIIADAAAPATLVELADAEGRPVYLRQATIDHFRRQGIQTLTLTVGLEPDTPPREWLTTTEAARLHLADVSGLTLHASRVKVTRACASKKIVSIGDGTKRRLEPNSLNAWRLTEREKELDREDSELV